jgi:acyl-coenzyme A thioesterase 13
VGCGVDVTPPTAFIAYSRTSRYLELVGPVYQHREDPSVIGLELDERHTNSRGFCHAGLLVALADTIMGHTIEQAASVPGRLVTVTLTTDFIGTAGIGDWIEGHAMIRRSGRRLAFGACEFRRQDRLVLTASAVFAVTP